MCVCVEAVRKDCEYKDHIEGDMAYAGRAYPRQTVNKLINTWGKKVLFFTERKHNLETQLILEKQ